ncbi:hypothetical protein TWF481_007130 [Arthrobotrys musiformis]|uniref:Apple domain-containing protein n=1 Tax=Arthrobotrys musiformis TaxID=47236 RepID=A0AAV9WAM4_9PEZI
MGFFNLNLSVFLFILLLIFQLTAITASAVEARVSSPKCDKTCAKAIIRRKYPRPPGAKSFCSSYLRAHHATSVRTVMVTRTATKTARTGCVTVVRTLVSTELDVFSEAVVTTTLPVITLTEYSSTVVIATGPTRVIDKRAVEETEIAPRAVSQCTCRNLSSCSSNTIIAACLGITPPRTSTSTTTRTITKPCTTISTTTSTTLKFTIITSGTATIYPAAETTTLDTIHTTLVPEECTRDLYTPPQEIGSAGVFFLEYPFFATNSLECCTACFARENCAASSYSGEVGSCAFLIVQEVQAGEKTGMCPLGRQDFGFVRDFDFGVNALPGPCGF